MENYQLENRTTSSNNWLTTLNSLEMQLKKQVRPQNSNLYAYAANNPVRYIDPDGNQSIYLPAGGTTFNGPCPGMRYNIEEYSQQCDTIATFVEGITSDGNALAILIDKVFLRNKFGDKANKFYAKVLWQFELTKIDAKSNGLFDIDKDGSYSEKETKLFADYVNNTMLLNYSDQSELGPYKVTIPHISENDADIFLNDKSIPSISEYDIKKFNAEINGGAEE